MTHNPVITPREDVNQVEDIGRKLRTLRKGKKLTQKDVADRLGLVRATISNYEVGRRTPHLSELKRFAELYGVTLDYFGVSQKDEMFELVSRAREVFSNENISTQDKETLYRELMKIYLNMK